MLTTTLFMIAGGVIGFALWHRRDLRRLTAAAEEIAKSRELASSEIDYRRATEQDRAFLDLLASRADDIAKQLEGQGFDCLGDIVLAPTRQIMRVWIDDTRTAIVMLIVLAEEPNLGTIMIESYEPDGEWSTIVAEANRPLLTCAPFSRRQLISPSTPLHEIVSRHRSFATSTALVRVSTFDELVAALRHNHGLWVDWRRAQSPDVLLEADLRSIFGARYDRWPAAALLRGARMPSNVLPLPLVRGASKIG